jgi:uncharacterized OB-fold protein
MTGMAGVRFWRETAVRYNLGGNRCGVCGTVYFPPRPVCLKCHRESIGNMVELRLKGAGEVLSFTVVHEMKRNFEMQLPYIMAIIRMDEGPALTAQLVDCSPQDVRIGSRVTAVFRKIGEDGKTGVIHYGYKFVLV